MPVTPAYPFLLSFLNLALLAGIPGLWGVKKYGFPFAISLVGLISTVLVFTFANLTKYFFCLTLIMGCAGLILSIRRADLRKCWNQGTIFLCAFACSFVLNYRLYPGFLYKVVGSYLQSYFYVMHQASIASEIWRFQGWSRLVDPFAWPSKLHGYHVGGDAVDAFGEVPWLSHNMVSYAMAHWAFVVCGLAYALFQGAQLFSSPGDRKEPAGKNDLLSACAFITLSSFFISLIGGLGNWYGLIAHAHGNSASWWGAFFILTSLLCFWKEDVLWSYYFLWVAACFKISVAPTALLLTPLYLRRVGPFRALMASLFPGLTFSFMILLSRIDRFRDPATALLRRPINMLTVDTWQVRGWSVPGYRQVYDSLFVHFSRIDPAHFHGALSWGLMEWNKISQGFLLISFQIIFPMLVVLALGSLASRIHRDLDTHAQKTGLIFMLACGIPALVIQTKANHHETVDPWMISLWLAAFIFSFSSAHLLANLFHHLPNPRRSWAAGATMIAALIFMRPDRVIFGLQFVDLAKKRKVLQNDVLLEDDPTYAAIFNMRIHRIVGDMDGILLSVKE